MHPNTPASSSYTSQDPPPHSRLWWDRLPSLKIVRPPKGPFSTQVDERCLTFCSQTITGRIHGHEPWCRSLCVRRVFLHEVTRVLAHHRTQVVRHAEEPGGRSRVETTDVVETAPVNHPLPPEGLRYSGWLHALVGFPADARSAESEQEGEGAGSTRYWKAGWYLWWSRSPWAAQEHIDIMRRSLESQTEWQRLKERRNEEWARGAMYDEQRVGEDAGGNRAHDDLGNLPPFPDVSHESVLLPFPDALPLEEQLENVLRPAGKVLALVGESVRSGNAQELGRRMYDKARTDEPIKLLRTACTMIWENMGFGDDDDDEGGERRKP